MDISRRDLLKRIGVAASVAALGPAALPEPASAHGDEPEEEGHEGEAHIEEGPESRNRLRRWAMVIDLRRCDGCVGLGVPPQCTQFCNWARFVPQDQQWVEVYRGHESDLPGAQDRFFPAPCMQCQNAPCTNVCPVGATFHTPEGVVLIDQERCIGCRLCMAACPYDRRFFNWGEPQQPDWVKETPYNVETQVPAMRGTVMKCDFCTDRTSVGGLPMCVEGCPRGAMWFGDMEEDVATNGAEVARLSVLIKENNAEPYKAELGTEPRVYYIPGHGEDAGEVEVDSPRFMNDQLEWPGSRTGTESREPAGASGGHDHG